MLVFTIYCDSVDLREGRQIQQISPALANAQVISIKQTITENPPFIQRLLRYDRPDVILVWDKKPVLVIELTSEVPSGHNVGQRWARLVRSMEEGIITGGFASLISENLIQRSSYPKTLQIGLPKKFIEHGTRDYIYQK